MTELITATLAHKLANPDFQTSLERYKDTINSSITEAAMGQVMTIQIRVPKEFDKELWDWLVKAGYSVEQILSEDLPEWTFLTVRWSNE